MRLRSLFAIRKWVGLFLESRLAKALPDKLYLKMKSYAYNMKIDIDNPKTFNEKLQWLKLYDRKPEYTRMVDKYEAKGYVAERIGEEYIIPTFGVWDKFNDIDFDSLPDQFVLKCTHDSGGLVICKDKSKLDIKSAKEKINRCLKRNYYWSGREWPYKNIKPRIIAEKFLENSNTIGLTDYKIQCFSGMVDSIFVCTERFSDSGAKYYYFDREWNYLPYCNVNYADSVDLENLRPKCLSKMIEISEKLSVGIPHLRVDLYNVDDKIYFGELTFYTQSGFDKSITPFADLEMGKKINIKGIN